MSKLQTRNVFDIDPESISDPYERKAVSAMRATALAVNCGAGATDANEELVRLSTELGLAPTMTYEDLIFRNTLDEETYVMSPFPPQAQDEAVFYVAHRDIEGYLADTIEDLTGGIPDRSLPRMESAVTRLVTLHRQLGAESFAAFRPYFRGLNGHPGPSGLFTAAIPIIDLLVHGGANLPSDERARMLRDIETGLYPSHQTEALTGLLINGSELALSSFVATGIVKYLNMFRKAHRGSVKKFVPQALDSHAEGSGGIADVGGYLASKIVHANKGGRS